MTRRLLHPLPQTIIEAQRSASDPTSSAWVSANAGSGKTHVLTDRVVRLLLSGAAPQEILCLTYTKAAAAEMRSRVGERLGAWTRLDDAQLADALQRLGETPTVAKLRRARSLFAHALETPGGLRIQTIHAFCESVLHRFPREAGVPFDFAVIEDYERDAMLLEAREAVLAEGIRGTHNAEAVETLLGMMSDYVIADAMTAALNRQPELRRVLAQKDAAKRELRKLLGHPGKVEDVLDAIVKGYPLTRADHETIFTYAQPSPQGTGFVDRLAAVDPERPDAQAIMDAFLTQSERTARKTMLKKAVATLIPDVAARAVTEGTRIEALMRRLGRAEMQARSEALLDLLDSIVARYEARKRARSLLDFDDLVERLSALLNDRSRGEWVRYKLDARLSHILVDEGQDTNPRQWEVIRALIDEFFAGESAAQRPRTLFAVGDQKQSIFSFQGADPQVFVELGLQVYFSALSVKLEMRRVPLHTSFRTLPNILAAVDKVFERDELREGTLGETVEHKTARAEAGGTVTLWPPIKAETDVTDTENWPQAVSQVQIRTAQRRVAERIARNIKSWLVEGRALGLRGRPVRPEDILILVQVRSVLFHEIIRALNQFGIPTPGADRLPVTTHIAALDLMALGDVLNNSTDDLQLAALLRSPLFDVSEEDLLALAHPRADGASLWSAMKQSTIPSVVAANDQLRTWRARLDFDRPFNFYADVLYREGGLKRLRTRLGAEVDDVVAEFLELALQHEQAAQPSLLGFLAELRRREVIIKRELAESGGGVRVMTVHGAKGLEAPIVILADAASTEEGRDRRSIYMDPELPLFFHASSKATHTEETQDYRMRADAAQQREYWRKLYVAMTRAEDELYVTGNLTKARDGRGSWYEAIEQALRPGSEVAVDADGVETALIYPQAEAGATFAATTGSAGVIAPPLLPELPIYRLRQIVRPSTAFTETDPNRVLDTPAERLSDPRDPEAARKEGIALHALLQHLTKVPSEAWPAVSAKALVVLLPEMPEAHPQIARKAIAILTRLDLMHLFGANSRAEVPILARGSRNGAPVLIAGRIDRVVVEPHKVLIVDYKSDTAPPPDAGGVPRSYVAQLGLYAQIAGQLFPGKTIEAAILWTSLESLMILPSEKLRQGISSFTIG